MSSIRIIAGGESPECARFTIGTGDSGVDLSLVSAASIALIPRAAGASSMAWDAVVEAGATADQVVIRHDFAEEDTAVLGRYAVVITLTVDGVGDVRAQCQDAIIANP